MKKILIAAVGMVCLSFTAQAADTSATIVRRETVKPVGSSPQIGFVNAISTVTTSFTVDLPVARTTADIIGIVSKVADSSGNEKNMNVTLSGNTIAVTSGIGPSNTLAVGDRLRAIVVYNP